MTMEHLVSQEQVSAVVPFAEELSDENLESLFGGAPRACGCGFICSLTAECGCFNGFTLCWPVNCN